MYKLNKTECLYVATKFNDEARAKLVIRWEELERERATGGYLVPQTFSEALRLAAEQAIAKIFCLIISRRSGFVRQNTTRIQ